jgi:hypothetical protein
MEDIANEKPLDNDGVIMVQQEPIPIIKAEDEDQKEDSPVEVQDDNHSPRSNNSSKKSKDQENGSEEENDHV